MRATGVDLLRKQYGVEVTPDRMLTSLLDATEGVHGRTACSGPLAVVVAMAARDAEGGA